MVSLKLPVWEHFRETSACNAIILSNRVVFHQAV